MLPVPRPALAALRSARSLVLIRRPFRLFHSYDHPSADAAFGSVEEAILAAAYRHVPQHSFSSKALGLGAREAGFLDISPSVLPGGVFSLIRYHLVTQRLGLAARNRQLLAQDRPRPSTEERVVELTWARLMANKDVIHQWQQALSIMAQPTWLPASLGELALLSDEIWFLAGDKAVDPSWYGKRASLSMIYSTAELFMTNDKSPEFFETKNFLYRRLGEAKAIGSIAGSVSRWVGFTMGAGINVLRSKGLPI